MCAEIIKRALAIVHGLERSSTNPDGCTRVQAIEDVLNFGPERLTAGELQVLCDALHVNRAEVKAAAFGELRKETT